MDILWYLIGLLKGKKQGEGHIVIEGEGYTFTDPNNDGNIVITKEESDG